MKQEVEDLMILLNTQRILPDRHAEEETESQIRVSQCPLQPAGLEIIEE